MLSITLLQNILPEPRATSLPDDDCGPSGNKTVAPFLVDPAPDNAPVGPIVLLDPSPPDRDIHLPEVDRLGAQCAAP